MGDQAVATGSDKDAVYAERWGVKVPLHDVVYFFDLNYLKVGAVPPLEASHRRGPEEGPHACP